MSRRKKLTILIDASCLMIEDRRELKSKVNIIVGQRLNKELLVERVGFDGDEQSEENEES